MNLITNGEMVTVTDIPSIEAGNVRIPMASAPTTIGDTVELRNDDGFVLAMFTVADYLRHYLDGTTLVLTNTPEPVTVEPSAEELAAAQIAALKAQLSKSDYKIIKCAEYSEAGLDAPYDITELHTERQALRDQINTLQGETDSSTT